VNERNFHKILVANRGEIALRIVGVIRALDKVAVVVHSESDRDLPFVTEADEAYSLGSGDPSTTYLHMEKILEAASMAQADAIHPGYGFLAENAAFARACLQKGIQFIGPDAEVIALMGHKARARNRASELGVPVLEGNTGDLETFILNRKQLPYPLLIKPAAGGGGKGMRIVSSAKQFETEAREAAREALNYFGSGELYVEKYLEDPRHIEVQVIADHHGHLVHLYERECTLQRRFQKIIEEAPSASISEESRDHITSVALQLAEDIGYTNAGTVEFLMDGHEDFYFLEMNTRIQVEHPVTEMITKVDLVKEQIRIAEGHPLSFSQKDISISGHSIEARIYAENTKNGFMPAAGRIHTFEVPVQDGTRMDSGFRAGNLVETHYDPMLAKAIVKGKTRDDAIHSLIAFLKEVRITGLATNRDFLVGLLRSNPFRKNRFDTGYIDREVDALLVSTQCGLKKLDRDYLFSAAVVIALQANYHHMSESDLPWYSIGHWRLLPEITLMMEGEPTRIRYELVKGPERMKLYIENENYQVALERRAGNDYWISINQKTLKVWGTTHHSEILVDLDGHLFMLRRMDVLDRRFIRSGKQKKEEESNEIMAPLNGRVVQINVNESDQVEEGDPLLVIESMKMENKILAPRKAGIEQVQTAVGAQVKANQLLITLANI